LNKNISQSDYESVGSSEKIDDLSYFSGALLEYMKKVPPEMYTMPEDKFIETYDLNTTDWALRTRYQEVLRKAVAAGETHIPAAALYKGIVTPQTFNVSVIPNPHRLAWMRRPIEDYRKQCEETFHMGMVKLKNYLKTVQVTEKNAAKILKLIEFCANRTYGPVIQKMQIHQRTEHLSLPEAQDVTPQLSPQNLLNTLDQVKDLLIKAKDVPTEEAEE
jgi:hypothetical protein